MKNWTIRKRILTSFALILALMIGMGGMAVHYFRSIEQAVRHVEADAMPGVQYSSRLFIEVLDAYALLERHVMADSRQDMQKLESQIQVREAAIASLLKKYETTIYQAQDQALFDAVKAARVPYVRSEDRILKLRAAQQDKQAAALFSAEIDPAFEALRSALRALQEYNEANHVSSTAHINASITRSYNAIAICLAVALIAALLAGQSLYRAVNHPLRRLLDALDQMRQGDFTERLKHSRQDEFGDVSEGFNRMMDELTALVGQVQKSGLQITTSVTEVSATARQQQATAAEIAATTAEIGATSKQIAVTSKELVRTMKAVSEVAEQSASLAGSGRTGLAQMEDAMRQVTEASSSITAKLALLSEKAGNINQVITTITKVADQTNLLSLNASIEAEKAGEHGRGFGVVATEIRRLADQTAVATYDIGQTVKEIQSAVSASVMGMDKFSEEVRRGMQAVEQVGGQLSEIIHQVQTLAPRVEAVNEGMQTQSDGADQIMQALLQLNEAAQQTVESLRQSTVAIDDLNQVAHGLRGGVSRFKLSAA